MCGMGVMKFSRRGKMVMILSYLNQSKQNAMTSPKDIKREERKKEKNNNKK